MGQGALFGGVGALGWLTSSLGLFEPALTLQAGCLGEQRQLRRVARPLRGVLQAVNADEKGLLAQITARAEEVLADIEIAQHFGFRSVAPAGLEVVAIPIGGSSAHLVVVGEIDRSTTPPTLVVGESCLYSTGGAAVVVKADGSVELNGAGPAVARVGDTAQPGVDMATWIAAVCTATGVSPPPDPAYVVFSGSSTVKAGG